MNTLSAKTCLTCGKSITGRIDKKFCDAQCRASFNNQKKHIHEQTILSTNRVLRRNRTILRTLSPEGKATVRKEVLDNMGYDFRYFSGLFKAKPSNNLYYLVYDYGFSPIVDDRGIEKALIVQRQDYMDKLTFDIWRK